MQTYPWAWLPFLSFVIISSFIILNLIIGVLCDAVAQIQAENMNRHLEHITSVASASPQTELLRLETKIDALAMSLQSMVKLQQ